MTKRSWADMSPRQRGLTVAVGIVQVSLFVAAQVDISRRPAEEIRGSKIGWRLLTLINFVGPITYFARGRIDPGRH